ncbi:MAG: NUDIX domain-containing protein [Pseudomonadota bacterium]|nr:NUDIX domain-containing protein [Pseudomonadota bacterium]
MKTSAGILLYRLVEGVPQVLLVHPGGPFWAKKDLGAWSVPKGEFTDEAPLVAARREFREELGRDVDGTFIPLSPVRQASGKLVHVWAVEGDFAVETLRSNTFEMTWPPRSGKVVAFPEVDRAAWFGLEEARRKINPGQVPLVDELEAILPGGEQGERGP